MYSQAFEIVTKCKLSFRETDQDDANTLHSVPVSAGVDETFYLTASFLGNVYEGDIEDQSSIRGLLHAFALQLGDDVNSAMLFSARTEPHALKKAKLYISERLHVKVSLSEVAEAVDICSFQLCRLFKAYTGITMTEYISRKRVEAARAQLRKSSQPVTQIAHEVGFTSLSQFNRNFLKYAGESPTEYRTRSKELEHCKLGVI